MKKILYIFVLIIGLTACETSPKQFNEAVLNFVSDAEIKVNTFDANVQKAMSKDDAGKINLLAEETTNSLSARLEDIRNLNPASDGVDLKTSAISYIESLIDLVQAQKVYSSYTNTITEQEASSMDDKVANIIRTVEVNHNIFIEYQQAFAKAKKLQ